MQVFMLLGSTFRSVQFRFLIIGARLEAGKGNSSEWTLFLWIWLLHHAELGYFLLLTFFYFFIDYFIVPQR